MSFALDSEPTPMLPVLDLRHRQVSPEQMRKFERYMREIFSAFGMDVDTPSTKLTPQRFVHALYDSTQGYDGDPKLLTTFDSESPEDAQSHSSQVIEGPIPFFALCEHHSLPFHGHAYIGYTPHQQIIGISKLTRLVRVFARRFTVQERLGQQITQALDTILAPYGVAVFLEAQHLCTAMRGVQESTPLTRTTTWRGEYESNAELRREFLAMSGLK
jgi:GTP cyclohydrolase IA